MRNTEDETKQRKTGSAAESEESKEASALWEETASLVEGGVVVVVGGPAEGGVSDITLMNQCQQSDEKIIKKQARSVLNTAKGKRPILLYWSTVRMENGNKWRQEQKSCRKKKKNPYHK